MLWFGIALSLVGLVMVGASNTDADALMGFAILAAGLLIFWRGLPSRPA